MSKKDLLLTLLEEAVCRCYSDDTCLIEKSMEQASVAKIYYYMQEALMSDNRFEVLRDYHLDSEYNKKEDREKTTARRPDGTRPDIILHKRGLDNDNLLVIEFKPRKINAKKYKTTKQYKHDFPDGTDTENIGEKYIDFIKLEDFTCSSGSYNYQLGVYVRLKKNNPEFKYFQNGSEKAKSELSAF